MAFAWKQEERVTMSFLALVPTYFPFLSFEYQESTNTEPTTHAKMPCDT